MDYCSSTWGGSGGAHPNSLLFPGTCLQLTPPIKRIVPRVCLTMYTSVLCRFIVCPFGFPCWQRRSILNHCPSHEKAVEMSLLPDVLLPGLLSQGWCIEEAITAAQFPYLGFCLSPPTTEPHLVLNSKMKGERLNIGQIANKRKHKKLLDAEARVRIWWTDVEIYSMIRVGSFRVV